MSPGGWVGRDTSTVGHQFLWLCELDAHLPCGASLACPEVQWITHARTTSLALASLWANKQLQHRACPVVQPQRLRATHGSSSMRQGTLISAHIPFLHCKCLPSVEGR